MATNFYKVNGSYYRSDTGAKVANVADLQVLAKAGGKEVSPPATKAPVATTPAAKPSQPVAAPAAKPSQAAPTTKKATLYGPPDSQPVVVDVGSAQASQLQSQGWGLTKGSYKAPVQQQASTPTSTPTISPAVQDTASLFQKLGIDTSTLTPSQAQTLSVMGSAIQINAASDKTIAPPSLSQADLNNYVTQAHSLLDPQFADNFKAFSADFANNVAQLTGEVPSQEQQQALAFQQQREQTASQMADAGLAQSGIRRKAESQLQTQQQGVIQSKALRSTRSGSCTFSNFTGICPSRYRSANAFLYTGRLAVSDPNSG